MRERYKGIDVVTGRVVYGYLIRENGKVYIVSEIWDINDFGKNVYEVREDSVEVV